MLGQPFTVGCRVGPGNVDDGPASAALWYRAGVVAEAVGDDDRAAALYDAALTLNPAFDPIDADDARARLDAL